MRPSASPGVMTQIRRNAAVPPFGSATPRAGCQSSPPASPSVNQIRGPQNGDVTDANSRPVRPSRIA